MVLSGTVISYPIPAYSNFPIESQFYEPSRFVISNLTLGQTTVVTTSVDHNYVIGQQVRLLIPSGFGCVQLNGSFGYVLAIPTTTSVEVDINSTKANSYVAATSTQNPQILAIGDINSGQINSSGRTSNGTYVPGRFINISPA